jgi:toxin ParE1/3/4
VKPIRFHPEAEAELTAAIAYYEGERNGLGVDFRKNVEDVTGRIRRTPQLFPARPADGYRKCPIKRFPYVVYYLDLDDEVWIAAVVHQHRRPGYWKNRSPQ